MFKVKLLLLTFFIISFAATAQQQEEEAYDREFNYGINFNTNGGLIGGGMIKSSRFLRGNWSKFYALELVEVKHPKENPIYSQETGNRFIFGKTNYLYVLRPQYGREYIFFRKAPESGVQVNGIFAAGPSIGLLVPYYIIYDYTDYTRRPNPIADFRSEQYDPNKHTDYDTKIRGSSGFFAGLPKTNFNLGLHVKGGLSFEYGRYREDVTGVEVGFLVEAYPNKLVMIPKANKNNSTFSSVYLTLYYGRRK